MFFCLFNAGKELDFLSFGAPFAVKTTLIGKYHRSPVTFFFPQEKSFLFFFLVPLLGNSGYGMYRHRMNCLSADVEDSAYIISRNAQKDKRVQLSDFIF
jgi:hypothetical protein